MAQTYLEVSISAENAEQADAILNPLLEQKLGTGGQLHYEPARLLWKGEVQDMDYVVIKSFTTSERKEKIMQIVRGKSVEDIPMIWFSEISGNSELLAWIDSTLA